MYLSIDVYYKDTGVVVAGVLFVDWTDAEPQREIVSRIDTVAPYQPGSFFKRELPCILQLIEEHAPAPEVVVIDGYVYLDGVERPGLGAHLYKSLGEKVSVIGVAKNPFKGVPARFGVLRGDSKKPLYVTAVGIDIEEAHRIVVSMHGIFRIPTLLKRVDQLCREA